MKKKFKVEVDCANCAAKIENAISKINPIILFIWLYFFPSYIVDGAEVLYDF